jgi:hypothetical protein
MVSATISKNVKVTTSLPPGKEHTAQDPALVKQNKEAAKQCLLLADRFIKEGEFAKARVEVEKAQKLDPSHPYISAFLDRISYFEEQKKKSPTSAGAVAATPTVQQTQAAATPPAQAVPPGSAAQPKGTPQQPVPPPPAAKKPVDTAKILESVKDSLASGAPKPSAQASASPHPTSIPPVSKGEVDSKLDEMRKQIEELTRALQEEKKAREEIREHQLQGAVNQLKAAMEKAWVNGAPKEAESVSLHQLALSLNIPPEVEASVKREVKIDMYSRAVKEVIAKRKLLRSSSTTLEWLRKVYQISVTEYLENESKFLLDLVADQYKGTIVLVAEESKGRQDLTNRLKGAGFAVVIAPAPELALEKVEKINPNVIVCEQDFSNGALSGIKFMHVLRANSKLNFIPYILICEKKDYDTLKSSELRSNEAIVKKPVDFDELSSIMNEKLIQLREYISSLV